MEAILRISSFMISTIAQTVTNMIVILTCLMMGVSLLYSKYFFWKVKTIHPFTIPHSIRKIIRFATVFFTFPFLSEGAYFKAVEDTFEMLSKSKTPRRFNSGIGLLQFVYIDKLDDVQTVLNSSKSLGKDRSYKLINDTIGEGLLTAPVTKWKKHRRFISPIFNTHSLETFFQIFNEHNRKLIKILEVEANTNEVIDLWKYLESVAFDITCGTLMNLDQDTMISEQEKIEFLKSYKRLMKYIIYVSRSILLNCPRFLLKIFSTIRGIDNDNAIVQSTIMKIIQNRKHALEMRKSTQDETAAIEHKEYRVTTFLDKMLKLSDEQDVKFSNKELQDEVMMMLVAGSDTTAITNCFTLLMLAMHPHIQDKVYNEVIDALGNEDRIVEMNDVQKMPFLEQCIRETLRVFPLAPFILREADSDMKLSENFIVKKGESILIPILKIHRSSDIYKAPELWNPDNFLPEEMEKRHKVSFLGFSAGPRGCVGGKYAILSLKLTISLILKKFSLTTDVKMKDITLIVDALLRSSAGYKVMLHTR